VKLIFKPVESTRYTEIAYVFNFIQKSKININTCLDISSPYILAYILSKKGTVIKTDIFEEERKFIKVSDKLRFEIQNALALTYPDNTFDFVSSISAVEHIYQGLSRSVDEMIRVVKPGGYIYISFPVSGKYQEEWLNDNIYSNQYKSGGKVFFQYRIDKSNLDLFLLNLKNVEIIGQDIYWEKADGTYNKMVSKLKILTGNNNLDFLRNSVINLYYGFTLLNSRPQGFDNAKDYGNISIILKKISK
jgi:SAM-dependent methyltransferase